MITGTEIVIATYTVCMTGVYLYTEDVIFAGLAFVGCLIYAIEIVLTTYLGHKIHVVDAKYDRALEILHEAKGLDDGYARSVLLEAVSCDLKGESK